MLKLGPVFTDNMVLQQGISVPLWGAAQPGSTVTARFAGQEKSAVADADGNWQLRLEPLAADAAPRQLTFVAGSDGETATLQNIVVGEVWICSGQSNMEWPVALSKNADAEIAAAGDPSLRLLTIPKRTSGVPLSTIQLDPWQTCTPESVATFSAVGYFFGRELRRRLNVPVGLINASWGGTVAEAWVSRAGLIRHPATAGLVAEYERAQPELQTLRAKHAEATRQLELRTKDVKNEGFPRGWADLPEPAGEWQAMELPCFWQNRGLNFSGILWFRKELELPAAWAGRDLRLAIGATDKSDVTYFNNTPVGSITMVDRPDAWSTLRNYLVPGHLVRAGKNVIAVRVHSDKYAGGMTGQAEVMRLSCPSLPDAASIELAGIWQYAVEANYGPVNFPAPPPGPDNQNSPCVLFNGMISPVAPFALRGAIWYQGESNASRATQYRTLFPALVQDWRQRWQLGEFPFLFVQLANYMTTLSQPAENAWAELREAQTMTLRLNNTGMAVAIDLGEASDIHPKNKQDVGLRLALNALNKVYHHPVSYSGPTFKRLTRESNGLKLDFDHVDGGLCCRGDKPQGFALAGADRQFVWAEAVIRGDSVIVSSPAVPEPEFVRYAWADNPVCNLYNAAGLPAVPFRSDAPQQP